MQAHPLHEDEETEMKNRELEAGAKYCGEDRRKARWHEIEIGCLAQREPAWAETRNGLPHQFAPSRSRGPRSVQAQTHGLARITQDGLHDGQSTRCAIAWRNGDLDLIDGTPASRERIKRSAGESGGGTGARYGENSGRPGFFIESRKRRHEIARVGDIHVMASGRNGRPRDAGFLILKGTGGIDHAEGTKPPDLRPGSGAVEHHGADPL